MPFERKSKCSPENSDGRNASGSIATICSTGLVSTVPIAPMIVTPTGAGAPLSQRDMFDPNANTVSPIVSTAWASANDSSHAIRRTMTAASIQA